MDYILEFDEFIRSIKQNIDTKYSFLLGAGASVESGIPCASECIWEWKRDIFISQNPTLAEMHNNIKSQNIKRSIQNWLDNQGTYPKEGEDIEYSYYIEKAFRIPDDRRKYFERNITGKTPSLGYHILCLLAEREIIKSVWTTNFDGLIIKAAHKYQLVPIEVTLESQDRIYRTDANKELLCIALHGDYKYGPLKNSKEELDSQSDIFVNALSFEASKRYFVVMGYSGRDKSLMQAIERSFCRSGAGRLYWCGYGRNIAPEVRLLIEKLNLYGREAFYIPTDGFDKTMLNIAHMCFEDKELQEEVEKLKADLGAGYECRTTTFSPYKEGVNKIVDTNVYPIKFPDKCYQFEVKNSSVMNLWDYCKQLIDYNIVAVPYNGMIYAWGNRNSISSMCGSNVNGTIELVPLTRKNFFDNGTLKSMLLKTLLIIIGKHSNCKYNRNKIWRESKKISYIINGKNIEAYQGIQFSLFMDWKFSYLTLTPAFYYKDRSKVSKEENKEFSDRFMEQICKMQANKNYAAYINHWINIIFPDNKSIISMYPCNSESGFEFTIVNKSLLVGLRARQALHNPDDDMKKRICMGGAELADTELKFYNPAQNAMHSDFHPMRGLINNKPYDYYMNNRLFKSNISLGVISPVGFEKKLENFLDRLNKKHKVNYNVDYVIDYPGFQSIYGVGLSIPLIAEWALLDDKMLNKANLYQACLNFGDQIKKKIEYLKSRDSVDVIIIYIPKEYELFTFFNDANIHYDLHDYVKAFSVQRHISTQFIREKTIDSELDCQIAWAISLAIYVKAGRTPWILSGLRTDTAFAGIGYSVDHIKMDNQTLIGCSHIYGADGQGLRYKLSKIKDVTFDSKNNPYLSENEAYQLGLNIKELFFDSFKTLPQRVVIHKRVPFQKQEIDGLTKCLGSAGVKDIDLIEITLEDRFRCFEYDRRLQIDGFPVKRGVCFAVNENTAYLYTHGIAPSVKNANLRYIQGGKSIPAPLKIVKHYGNGDLAQIATEILGLSKMNWNSFGLYSKLPCTIQSSNAIARVGWLLSQYEGVVYDYRNFM